MSPKWTKRAHARLNQINTNMIAHILTADEIRNCDGRNYNPTIWEQNVNDMLKYDDVVFYHVPRGNGYDYDRYYCEYTLPEGLRLINPFGYSAMISDRGFSRLDAFPITDDGKTNADAFELMKTGKMDEGLALFERLRQAKTYDITASPFYDIEGNKVYFGTSDEARREMTRRSREHGMTFTKGL